MSVGGAARGSVLALLVGCGGGDTIVVEVAGDLAVGSGVDAICLGVADRDPAGGHFGQAYRLESLPQTLRVEAGSAVEADAWVVGYRAGVPIARDARVLDFTGDVTLRLDRCYENAAGAPQMQGSPTGPAAAILVPLSGRGGARVAAIGSGDASVIDVDAGGGLVETAAPAPPAGSVRTALGFDADGDCDDDVVVVTDGAAPMVWTAEADELTATTGSIGSMPVRTAAAADVDRDGDIDLVTAAGSDLVLYRNDGSGRFVADVSALTGVGFVADATALAFADLDGDGSVDLVVGQDAGPLRAFVGDPGGAGVFVGAPGVLPDLPLTARALRLADADGDGDPDLWVAVAGGPARLYVDRAGRLENQSFVKLPQPTPEATAIAVGSWDADCATDAAIAAPAGGALWRGDGAGNLVGDGAAPGSTAAELIDLDDDGDLDLVLATPGGVTWLVR